MQFLQKTGESKFKVMETTFLNSVNEWREKFKKEVKEQDDKYIAKIGEALEKGFLGY